MFGLMIRLLRQQQERCSVVVRFVVAIVIALISLPTCFSSSYYDQPYYSSSCNPNRQSQQYSSKTTTFISQQKQSISTTTTWYQKQNNNDHDDDDNPIKRRKYANNFIGTTYNHLCCGTIITRSRILSIIGKRNRNSRIQRAMSFQVDDDDNVMNNENVISQRVNLIRSSSSLQQRNNKDHEKKQIAFKNIKGNFFPKNETVTIDSEQQQQQQQMMMMNTSKDELIIHENTLLEMNVDKMELKRNLEDNGLNSPTISSSNNSGVGLVNITKATTTVEEKGIRHNPSKSNPIADMQISLGLITFPESSRNNKHKNDNRNKINTYGLGKKDSSSSSTMNPVEEKTSDKSNTINKMTPTENKTSNSTSTNINVPTPLMYFLPTIENGLQTWKKVENGSLESLFQMVGASIPFPTVVVTNTSIILTSNNTSSWHQKYNLTNAILLPTNLSGFNDVSITNLLQQLYEISSGAINNTTKVLNDQIINSSTSQKRSGQSSSSSKTTSSILLLKPAVENLLQRRNPNDVLTIADLQSIIDESIYENSMTSRRYPVYDKGRNDKNYGITAMNSTMKTFESGKKDSTKTAFPQPSILSEKALKRGCVVSGSIFGMLAGMSILPNLWLMGAIFGSIYGYETGNQFYSAKNSLVNIKKSSNVTTTSVDSVYKFNVIQNIIIALGRRIARNYLILYDYYQGIYFMYKTGLLSYEYYKTYSSLDEKFHIQNKINAWNSIFVEGKLKFDQWEKENEIGRKALAGLRTFWLIEERNQKNLRRTTTTIFFLSNNRDYQSKYRLVQYSYDIWYEIQSLIKLGWEKIWYRIGQGSIFHDTKDFVKQMIFKLKDNSSTTKLRIGSAVTTFISVAMFGSLFTISPKFMLFLSIILGGIIWPSWIDELYQRIDRYIYELKSASSSSSAGGALSSPSKKINHRDSSPPKSSVNPIVDLFLSTKFTEDVKYHYYRQMNGKKRYFRVGVSPFARFTAVSSSSSNQKKGIKGTPWQWQFWKSSKNKKQQTKSNPFFPFFEE